MLILSCLIAVILSLRSNLVQEDRLLAHRMSSLAWKVSETLFEAQRVELALQGLQLGTKDVEDVELAFELIWSRLSVLRHTVVVKEMDLAQSLDELEAFLQRNEEVIFDNSEELVRSADQLINDIAIWHDRFRAEWIAQRELSREKVLKQVTSQGGVTRQLSEILIAACIMALGAYMALELIVSTRAHAREKRLRREAIAANEAKSLFLANVSHEVRTPLNGVLGMTQELRESDLDKDQAHLVDIIGASGEMLLATINDVLNLSKIEAGKMEMEARPFDLRSRLLQCIDMQRVAAERKGLDVSFLYDGGLPTQVRGDPMRLAQVVSNLLSNAIKFTSQGQVDVIVRQAGEIKTGQVPISISVRDTGIGITPEAQAMIFTPFSQAEAATARQYGGTGLGLSIARSICEIMHGSLSLVSEPGQGSTFTARIQMGVVENSVEDPDLTQDADRPARPTSDAADGRLSEPQSVALSIPNPPVAGALNVSREADALRVMVVDDSATNRMVLKRFLGRAGVTTFVEAATGEQAVELAKANESDVIFMDIRMPGIDGLEATRQIRKAHSGSGAMPVFVAVTANVLPDQVKDYLDAGMDSVLAKPLRFEEVRDLIASFSQSQAA